MLDEILLNIHKPGRYIGQEWNMSKKDFDNCNIKFALCFPDLYEVGMSNLGIRIIYGILNSLPDVVCERFFACGSDMEANLRQKGKEIFSLENHKALREFDIAGFSLAHELSYTNVLAILDLGKVPLKADGRGNNYPLIIGGGPCMMNPEPVYEFFDLFIIGEAEEAIVEFIDFYRKVKTDYKSGKLSKYELLKAASAIEGIYAPSLYEVEYGDDYGIKEFKPKSAGIKSKVKKRIVKDLNQSFVSLKWIVPYIQIVHDRITLEIMRGCPNSCRFCQARHQYAPFRKRSIDNILNAAQQSYKNSGYEEIALGGLSVSDYPQIEELLKVLIAFFKTECVSVSLPSIKPKIMLGELSSLIATIKKTGLTFAPEAAAQKLRDILGKDFSTQDFFKVIEQAFASGYQRVKLYFMAGVPFEQNSDLDEIVNFAVKVSELRRKFKNRPAQVNLSINTLIPKPHTPFQWLKMEDLNSMLYKQEYLKKQVKKHRMIKLSFHDPYLSFLEGVLSRGDRRLSSVILNAYNAGARLEGWQENFSFQRWIKAFEDAGIDPQVYLREKLKEQLLPWDLLDIGVSKELLLKELSRVDKLIDNQE
ncbi:MAG: TIGR03960 family B12-binding radical SAM protein [Candidatus Omnitrophota bacterium]